MKKYVPIIIVILIGLFILFQILPEQSIKNYPSDGIDIIAFGDSLVQGVGSINSGNFVSVLSKKIGRPIINLGHSGDTTYDGLARINDLDKYRPKVVMVLLGGNDYLKKISIAETEANLVKIIKNIQDRGAIVLLLGVRGGLLNDRFEKMFQGLSNKYETAYVKDVLRGLIADMRYMSDAVHPNNAGYAIIADKVYPVLVDLVR